jgi:hypothetical protein
MAFRFHSVRQVASEKCPGVTFSVRVLTQGQQVELLKLMEPFQERLLQSQKESIELMARVRGNGAETNGAPKGAPVKVDAQLFADQEASRIKADYLVDLELNPIWMKWGLVSLEGLEDDGGPVPVEEPSRFPPDLYKEILAEIHKERGLTPDQIKNWLWPTILPQSAAGPTADTTVDTASNTESIQPEIVTAISPAT